MSQRANQIAQRIKSFSKDVVTFVEQLSADEWNKVCEWEQWTVGVTAHHIGKGHLAIYEMAGMIIQGEALPPLDMDQINAMSKQQAQEHANCTMAEALNELQKNTTQIVKFVSALSDEELDLKGSMPAFGGEVTVEQLFDYVLFQSAGQHFEHMKAAVGT